MNFYLPPNDNVREYLEYLGKFTWKSVPDPHRDAWFALSYLSSNYHRSADSTAELTVAFYRGLQTFIKAKGE